MSAGPLPWVRVCPHAPYFETEDGIAWTPVGYNDAIDWVNLAGLFRRRDLAAVSRHFAFLRASGVNCLRLMLEYSQRPHRAFERPAGAVVPAMVRLWDDLFALCAQHGLRILLTPYDTFWMARRLSRHAYSTARGGPLERMGEFLPSFAARRLIRERLEFVVRRWGGSGALFGWDLMNEIGPALNGGRETGLGEFVHDVSSHVRQLETALYGRSHPQCVSVFGPDLDGPHGAALADLAFRHPDLDFATTHFYAPATIDSPENTVDAAVTVGALVRRAVAAAPANRPFLDTESGPIHDFNDRRRTLPADFDTEYFRHMQWAHLASGGAGGGMRWPYRHPHRLTDAMHAAQATLSAFAAAAIDWRGFRRKALEGRLRVEDRQLAVFGCGDDDGAVLWLLRRDASGPDGMMDAQAPAREATLHIDGLSLDAREATAFDTRSGASRRVLVSHDRSGTATLRTPAFRHDLALAIRRSPEGL